MAAGSALALLAKKHAEQFYENVVYYLHWVQGFAVLCIIRIILYVIISLFRTDGREFRAQNHITQTVMEHQRFAAASKGTCYVMLLQCS